MTTFPKENFDKNQLERYLADFLHRPSYFDQKRLQNGGLIMTLLWLCQLFTSDHMCLQPLSFFVEFF